MHINCHKDDLVYGVQVVSRAVSNKNTLPILNGILLEAKNNQLKLNSTDLEISIDCLIDVEVIQEGKLIVPGRYFTEIVKRLPSGLINLNSTDNFGLEIRYEQSQLSINGYAPDEFPLTPEIKGDFTGNIDQNLFKKMIRQVSIASSADESRPVFTGILMEITDNKVIFVATDTHRLALREGSWNGLPVQEKVSFIIPTKTMLEVARIAVDEPEPLFIYFEKNQVYFKAGNITIISRLIEGQYPSYRQVIPENTKCKSKIRIRKKQLLETAERASVLVRDEIKEKYSLIKLNVHDDILEVNSNSPEIGEIYEKINIYLEGEATDIIFNSRYLIDALKAVDSEEIYVELTGPLSPGIIKPVENEEEYIYLILPVRTI